VWKANQRKEIHETQGEVWNIPQKRAAAVQTDDNVVTTTLLKRVKLSHLLISPRGSLKDILSSTGSTPEYCWYYNRSQFSPVLRVKRSPRAQTMVCSAFRYTGFARDPLKR